MTTSSTDVDVYTGTATAWRANGLAISNALTAVGFNKTADTGQIDWASAALPSAGASGGYEIRVFSDPLQATKPIYCKIEFSRGNWSLTYRCTFGTGSNGSGTITGATLIAGGYSSSTTTPLAGQYTRQTRASGKMTSAAAYVSLSWANNQPDGELASGSSNILGNFLGIQRTVDSSGAPTGDGFFVMYRDTQQIANCVQDFYDFSRAAWRGGAQLFMNNNSSSYQDPIIAPPTGSSGIYLTEFAVMPFLSLGTWRMENPVPDWVGVHKGVRAIGDEFSISRFGASHTYKVTPNMLRTADTAAQAIVWTLAHLWE